jgi:phage shock protein C
MSVNDRLYRSVDDRVLGGVCAGLADRLDLDPALVRIGYAILALVTGIFPLLVLYVIMVVVIPEEPSWTGVRPVVPQPTGPAWPGTGGPAAPTGPDAQADPSIGEAPGSVGTPPAASMPADPAAVPGWIPPGYSGGWDNRSWREQRSATRATRRAERAARRAERRDDPVPAIIGGIFLVGLGAFFLLRNTFDIDWSVVWPVVLIAFGVVVLIAAFRPRAR